MGFWPFARRRVAPEASLDDLLITEDLLRRTAEDVFDVGDRPARGGIIVFRGQLRTEPRHALDVLLERFRPFGCTPFLRVVRAGVRMQAWPPGEERAGPPGGR